MIGNNGQDLSKYLINFNSADWANQINNHLQQILSQGMNYSQQNTQQAVKALQDYQNQSRQDLQKGFNQAQQLSAPQRMATYNALDAYTRSLGLPTPAGGSYNMSQGLLAPVSQSNVPIPQASIAPAVSPSSSLIPQGYLGPPVRRQ